MLQSNASFRGRPTKFLVVFFYNFWHVLDNFLMASHCIWPIIMQGLWEAELSIVGKPPSFSILIGQFKSHQKVVKKMSQNCQILIKNFVGWPPDAIDCKGVTITYFLLCPNPGGGVPPQIESTGLICWTGYGFLTSCHRQGIHFAVCELLIRVLCHRQGVSFVDWDVSINGLYSTGSLTRL